MNELALHIEALLLENDCVIVPGLGGFVAHYTPAKRVEGEDLFLPPMRMIGFNPQLKMNDGVLVQSYMAVYGTNFPDATRIVEQQVKELRSRLYEEGKADLPNVGELHYSIRQTYDFVPYDNKITTPSLYGLDSFELRELPVEEKPSHPTRPSFDVPLLTQRHRRRWEARTVRSLLANGLVLAVVVVLGILLSVPVENTGVMQENYANLLPEELFEKIESQSLAITPLFNYNRCEEKKKIEAAVAGDPVKPVPKEAEREKAVSPVAVKEMKTLQPPLSPSYYVIVASMATRKDAQAMAGQLKEAGYQSAQVLEGDGKIRVSLQACTTRQEAYDVLKQIRRQEKFQAAWVLKQ